MLPYEFSPSTIRVNGSQPGIRMRFGGSRRERSCSPGMTISPIRHSRRQSREPCCTRAGPASYEAFEYRNGYSILDVDIARSSTVVRLRDWSPAREEFVPAEADIADGLLTVPWPPSTDALIKRADVPFSRVMLGLSDIVQQRSIISDYLEERRSDTKVDEILVPPRLWPASYREVVAVAMQGEAEARRPQSVEIRDLLASPNVVIVAGDPESGVTGTLLWLLAHRFGTEETRLPVFLPFDSRFKADRFERWVRRELDRYGVTDDAHAGIGRIIAVDDVAPAHAGAMTAFVRFVKDHPNDRFILGCHGNITKTLFGSFLGRRLEYRPSMSAHSDAVSYEPSWRESPVLPRTSLWIASRPSFEVSGYRETRSSSRRW